MNIRERVKFRADVNGTEKLIVKDRFKIVFDGKSAGGRMSATVFASDMEMDTPFRKTLSFERSEYGIELRDGIFEHDIVTFSYGDSTYSGVVTDDREMRVSYVLDNENRKWPLYKIGSMQVIGSTLSERAASTRTEADKASDERSVPHTHLELFTDGSAISNPGPCGFAYVIVQDGEVISEKSSPLGNGTNNIAELTAVIEGLKDALSRSPEKVTVYSDSKYVVDGITKWYKGWLKKGWVSSSGEPVKNRELWEKLLDIKRGFDIDFKWVRGHNDNRYNERCDFLAQEAAKSQ